MRCPACGIENPDHATLCGKCGSAFATLSAADAALATDLSAERPFFCSTSARKLFILGGLTFGLYTIYWLGKQWKADDPKQGAVWILVKTVLSGFFFYSMAQGVKDEAERVDVPCGYSSAALTALLWLAAITVRTVPEPWRLASVWLIPVPFAIVQGSINRVNWATTQQAPLRWRWWEIAIAVVCGVFWWLIILGLVLKAIAR